MFVSDLIKPFKPAALKLNIRGFLIALVLGIAAQFLSDHYGAPSMLMALLLGMAFYFLSQDENIRPGIDFTAKTVLRIGVGLLGLRISTDLILSLGGDLIGLVVLAVILTLVFGLAMAFMLGRGWRFGVLTGGSVAICGASAAMAISAVLPQHEHQERNLIFTVMGVTILSTIAMIIYPILSDSLGFNHHIAGVFLGGTIHDVAQVVGASFSISPEAGEVATLVKLIRVAMLAPVVLVISLMVRHFISHDNSLNPQDKQKKPPLLPFFVIAFIIFASLNSFGLVPSLLSDSMAQLSKWALLIAIAAVGMKTSLKDIFEVGGQAIIIIVAETLFIGLLVLGGVYYLGYG